MSFALAPLLAESFADSLNYFLSLSFWHVSLCVMKVDHAKTHLTTGSWILMKCWISSKMLPETFHSWRYYVFVLLYVNFGEWFKINSHYVIGFGKLHFQYIMFWLMIFISIWFSEILHDVSITRLTEITLQF